MGERVYLNDTAIIEADLFTDTQGMSPATNVTGVNWDLIDPNGNTLILSSLPVSTISGDTVILNQTTGGFNQWDEVQWNGSQWTRIGAADSHLDNYIATLTIPGEITSIEGVYKAVVHFTLPGPGNGIRKSLPIPFEVMDPLALSGHPPVETVEQVAIDRAWMKLEDCFDSTLGGPWLRDATKSFFNRTKMAKLTPDAVYRINYTYYPITTFTETTFDFTNDGPLFSQSLLVETIYHLMRSYTEQPVPTGSPIVWMNKTDYANRWKPILEQEEKKFNTWLDTWKSQFFQFGAGAMLIGGYASTAMRAPRALRTRLPRYYAGMYRRW